MTTAYVYKWTHLPTMKWYVGSRTADGCHPDDGYLCSSKVVKPLIESANGDWKREIIAVGSREEMLLLEEEILTLFDAKNDDRSFNRSNSVLRKDGRSTKGKKRIFLENKQLTVSETEVEIFLKLGWKMGFPNELIKKFQDSAPNYSGEKNPMYGVKRVAWNKGIRMTKEQTSNYYKFGVQRCEHCGKTCSEGNHARWHGTKCKHNLVATEINVQLKKGEANV